MDARCWPFYLDAFRFYRWVSELRPFGWNMHIVQKIKSLIVNIITDCISKEFTKIMIKCIAVYLVSFMCNQELFICNIILSFKYRIFPLTWLVTWIFHQVVPSIKVGPQQSVFILPVGYYGDRAAAILVVLMTLCLHQIHALKCIFLVLYNQCRVRAQ